MSKCEMYKTGNAPFNVFFFLNLIHSINVCSLTAFLPPVTLQKWSPDKANNVMLSLL